MISNSQSWVLNRKHDHHPDPFTDYASTVMPENILDHHRWAEFIMSKHGVYKSAIKRVISYFITDLSVGDDETGDDEKKKYSEFFNDTLHAKKVLFRLAMNYITYGNVFTSLILPFRRYLSCPVCNAEHPLRVVYTYPQYKFQWREFQFHAHCQGKKKDGTPCKYSGAWNRIDRRTSEETGIRVKVWNPKQIDIKYDEYSETREYIWRIPEIYKTKIKQGHLQYLENANWEIIECIRQDKNLEFAPGVIYHLFDDSLAGHETAGWGISSIIANFTQAWYVQVLHRYNEANAMEGIVPLRVITPSPGKSANPEAGDPLLNHNMGSMMARLRAMLRRRRFNPTEWFTQPFPVEYNAFGGDAKNMAPFELIDQGVSLLLNNIGVPVEMYKGSLSLQAAPPALRLFENTWTYLVSGMNEFLQSLADQVASSLSWDPVRIKLISPRIIDDLQDQMARLQLMMGKQISQTTGLQSLNIDFREEQRRILEEERYVQEQQAKLQKEMDQAASMDQMLAPVPPGGAPMPGDPNAQGAQGAPGAGGAPQGGGAATNAAQNVAAQMPTTPNGPVSPQQLIGKAQTIAQQMMQMPEGQRRSELGSLKTSDPVIHSLVRAEIDSLRQKAQTAGGNQLLAQQFGGGH